MLRIGEFSMLTGISIHMLRHYDSIGLLIPQYTDQTSGYRYYSEKQIVAANQIVALKKLGFGLTEIINIQSQSDNAAYCMHAIHEKIEEKKKEAERIFDQINLMNQALAELADHEECALTVTVKTVPARKVVCLRGNISRFEDEGRLWQQLDEACTRHGIKTANMDYAFAVTHHVDLLKPQMDIEVQRVVDNIGKDTDAIRFQDVPGCEAAAIAFQGDYNKLFAIHAYMANWLDVNRYRLCGQVFSIYYRSPDNEQHSDNYITELYYPIKKLSSSY